MGLKFTPLRAHGVLDADDNLDCWDTPPFELARAHVAALTAKDPAAGWRLAKLYVEAAPVEPPEDEFWLIERGPNQGQLPHVWWLKTERPYAHDWVTDALKATRFATKTEAEKAVAENYATHCVVTSHGILMAAAPAPVPAPTEAPKPTADEIELLARSAGLKGPADAWTILRGAISALARGIEADARRAGAESPVPSGTRPEPQGSQEGTINGNV